MPEGEGSTEETRPPPDGGSTSGGDTVFDARRFARSFLGRRLGRYRIVEEIGHGSMGIVFRAVAEPERDPVALKVLPPSLSVTSTVVRRFAREAEAIAALRHENIVRILETGETDGVHWYAMQLVEGQALDQVLRERTFRPAEAARIAARCARALFYAHEHGIIHRDVKPANVILTYKDRPVLTDFGLARPEKAATLTESGALVGTPLYMSPEQVRGERRAIDRRTDVYSLGVTLYEMLAGRPPFEGESTQEILRRIEEDDPKPLRRLRKDVPKALERICRKAMEKDPDDRYPTAIEFALDLERFLAGEPVQARPSGLARRLLRRARRHPAVTTLGALFVVVTLAFAASSLHGRKRMRESQRADFERHLRNGEVLMAKKDWDDALEHFDAALRIDPSAAAPLVERGKCRYLLENYEGALADFERALELDPRNGRARLWRGILLWRMGHADEGLSDLRETLDENPDDRECLLQAARLCLELAGSSANPELREAFLNAGWRRIGRLLELNPRDDDALVMRGLFYEAQGLPDLALESYEKAIEINPNNVQAWALRSVERETPANETETDLPPPIDTTRVLEPLLGVLAARGVGWATRELDLSTDEIWARAAEVLGRLRPELGARDRDVDERLAEAERLWGEGSRDRAAEIYRSLLEEHPDIAAANLRLAEYHLVRREPAQARPFADRLLAITPENPRTLWVAAQVYAAAGDREKLREVLSRARRLHPGILQDEKVRRLFAELGWPLDDLLPEADEPNDGDEKEGAEREPSEEAGDGG